MPTASATAPATMREPLELESDTIDDFSDDDPSLQGDSVYEDAADVAEGDTVPTKNLRKGTCKVKFAGNRLCGRDANKCRRDGHPAIRAKVKAGTLPPSALGKCGLCHELPATRSNGDTDGLQDSYFTDAEEREFRAIELQEKRDAQNNAALSSPSMNISYKTPEHGLRPEEAIDVASGPPIEDMQAKVSRLEREVRRLEMAALESSSTVAPSAATSPSPAVAKDPPRRVVRPALKTAPVPPSVSNDSSAEIISVLEAMLVPMKKFQEDVSDRLTGLEESQMNTPISVASSAHDQPAEKRVKRWWAVARGWKPGIYSTWYGTDGAKQQVKGYSNALSKSFKKHKKAVEWYYENHEDSSSDSDSRSESGSPSGSSTASSVSTVPRRKHHRKGHQKDRKSKDRKSKDRKSKDRKSKDLAVPTSQVDKSEGTRNEVFGVPVTAPDLLEQLCPGIDSPEIRTELAQATIDASSLPGTYSPSDSSLDFAALTGAFQDMQRSTTSKAPVRDTQYKSAGRNALSKVTTVVKLHEITTKIHKIKSSVVDGMGTDMRSTLSELYWPEAQVEMFLLVGRLPLMSRMSVDLFGQLLMNFQRISFKQDAGWERAKVDLDYFAEALQDIRTAASSRLSLIVKTYAFLRDAVASGFSNAQLTDARHTHTMKMLSALSHPTSGTPRANTHGENLCPHCQQADLHPLGKSLGNSLCCFSSLPRTKARQAARTVVDKLAADPSLNVSATCIAAVHSQNI
jgi:hypothetical protein